MSKFFHALMRRMSFDDRVWFGDLRTVAEARKQFREDSNRETLLRYASTLYTFDYPILFWYSREFEGLSGDLVKLAYDPFWGRRVRSPKESLEIASQGETLFTFLVALGGHQRLSEDERNQLHDAALSLELHVARQAAHFALKPEHAHIYLLLKVRKVLMEVELERHELGLKNEVRAELFVEEMREQLDMLSQRSGIVADPNQRARVFRLLGTTYRVLSYTTRDGRLSQELWDAGSAWGRAAYSVPGSTFFTRLKGHAAFW